MVGVGVVGYGYWGPNLVRNFSEAPGTHVVSVCDTRPDRLSLAERRCPGIQTTAQYEELLRNPQVDAVAISTPVSTHFPLAMRALAPENTYSSKSRSRRVQRTPQRLIEEAEKRRLTLMVDHTFVYTGAVRKISELVADGRLGDIYYYDSYPHQPRTVSA